MQSGEGDQDHGGALLKPDDEDPEPYFSLQETTGELLPHPSLSEDGRRRALETIRLCDLQRPALCANRIEMMNRVRLWLKLSAGNTPLHILEEEWASLSNRATQYKFVVRYVLKDDSDLAAEDRRLFEQ